MKEEKLKVLSLFSGIGAFEKALTNLNVDYKLVGFSEIDKWAIKSYCAIHDISEELNLGDVSKIDANKLPKNIDLLTHGSPCQSFSIIGKQEGGDFGAGTTSSLMWETVRIIKNIKPRFVIWENVKAVLNKNHNHNFNKYLKEMSNMGYISSYKVLNTRDFGIPQNRERVFVVSILGESGFSFNTLEKTKMISFDEIKDLKFKEKHIVTQPSMLKQIGDKIKIINNYCWTITTKQMRSPNSGVVDLKDGRYRYLTEKECWLLQGFSEDDFMKAKKVNNYRDKYLCSSLYKQAGNSISVNVLEAIFKQID